MKTTKNTQKMVILWPIAAMTLLYAVTCFWFALMTKPPRLPNIAMPLDAPMELFVAEGYTYQDETDFHELKDGLLPYRERGQRLTVAFDGSQAFISANGMWSGKGYVVISGGKKVQAVPIPKKWDDKIIISTSSIIPRFNITIPLSKSDIHKTLDIKAVLNVNYPYFTGKMTDIISSTLVKNFKVLVISGKDDKARNGILSLQPVVERWEKDRKTNIIKGIVFLIFSALAVFVLYIKKVEV